MANELVPVENIFGGEQKIVFWTSLETTDIKGKMAVQKALGNSDYKAEDIAQVPFPVRDVVVHNVRIESDNGETVEAYRAVLISPDGKTVSFTSEGVIASLRSIFSIFGLPPWQPALLVQAKDVKTRRGYRTINLVVVGQENER